MAVQGFPARGERISQIVAFGSGFVAVGWAEHPTTECRYRNDGRIWSSDDGQHWLRRDADALADAPLRNLVVFDGAAYAFGYVGLPGDCPLPDGFGNNAWRSTDGITWQRITNGAGTLSEADRFNDVAVAGDHLVAVGRVGEVGDEESPGGGVWTSGDGIAWRAADQPPAGRDMVSVAAIGQTVVVFGDDASFGLAWYSPDGGRTWLPSAFDSGYLPYFIDVVAANGQFVAAATACCGLPGRVVGVEFASADGRSWTNAASARRAPGERTDGFGERLVVFAAAEVRVLGDGRPWRAFRTHDLSDSATLAAAAVGAPGAVLAAWADIDGSLGQRAYFASTATLTGPGVTPLAADKVEIGRAYRYELYTHCGTENTRVAFDGSVRIIDQVESGPFRNPSDRGRLTKLDAGSARYTNSRGGSILLRRTATPPPWAQCA